MARLTRLVLMFASIVGTLTVAPAPSSAGAIPWVYNAIFGPVGSTYAGPSYASYRTRRHAATTVAYVPASSYGGGCSNCNQSTYYAPYTASYAPYTTSYAPSYGYDGFYGNYSQTAYYGGQANYGSACCNTCSGCSTCGYGQSCSSCGGGGCSSCNNGVSYANFNGGSTCSNCSVNSAPTQSGPTPAYGSNSSGYGSNNSSYGTNPNYGSNNVGAPVPDPYNSRDINARLNELEHRQTEDEKFLRKLHKDDYVPDPYKSRPSTYREREENVPARRRETTIKSNPADPDNYEPPIRNRPAPLTEPFEGEDRRKPVLAAPTPIDDGTNGKGKDEAVNFREEAPQTRRLEDRSTTQAIAPKQRMQIVTKQNKAMIAKSNQPVKTSSANSDSAGLAKN